MIVKQILAVSTLIAGISFGAWKADTGKAKISFTVKGLFGTVHGSFSGLESTIRFREKELTGSSISASVEAKTVSTGISLRNSDLRNKEEWFNVAKYPRISFRSANFEKTPNGYKVKGELTIKGISKPVEIPFTFTSKGGEGLFKGQFTINRNDYNLGKPGGSVGNVITVTLDIPVKGENP